MTDPLHGNFKNFSSCLEKSFQKAFSEIMRLKASISLLKGGFFLSFSSRLKHQHGKNALLRAQIIAPEHKHSPIPLPLPLFSPLFTEKQEKLIPMSVSLKKKKYFGNTLSYNYPVILISTLCIFTIIFGHLFYELYYVL